MALPTANSLAAQLAAAKPEAFGALYDRLGRSMLRVAGVMLHSQIAEVLNKNPNTVASRYRYAIEKLRRILE